MLQTKAHRPSTAQKSSVQMADPKPRKVIAQVKCGEITLKLTLTAKVLAKPLKDGCITPFLGAYNKKHPDQPPLTAEALARVEIDGVVVPSIDALGDGLMTGDVTKVELFPPGSAPAAAPAPAPAPVAAPTPPPPAPTPAAKPAPTSAATPTCLPVGTPMASNTMPKCKYGLACRIIDPVVEMTSKLPIEQQHWYKFQHPCYWVCKEGHPDLGPPGCLCPLDKAKYKDGKEASAAELAAKIVPCTNMDPDHRRCFRHPEDDFVAEEVVDETADELDLAVVVGDAWQPPEVGEVGEEAAMEAKMAGAEAASEGDFEKAVGAYTKALAAMPSALLYAKRAEALLKLGFPTAAAADCAKALELNPDSAKAYKVYGKALTKGGKFADAYAKLCTGNKIDEDEDSKELQKTLKAKIDKLKKIGEARTKRANAAFESVGLGDVWASLELDVYEKYGAADLEALAKWKASDVVSLKARLGSLGATEEQMDNVLALLPACITIA